jgi:rod shape-determining protein MreC
MRNLFVLLWKNYFFILFLLFEALCIYLIVQNNSFQRASFINSTNTGVATIYGAVNNVTNYIHLKAVNEALSKENAHLHSAMANSFLSPCADSTQVVDTVLKQQYTYMSARVINNTINKRNNYLTLDKGSSNGVKPEMAVISSSGVVGIVKDVSENFCSVLSLLHKETKISAKVAKSGYFGPLVWEGGDYRRANLLDIAKHVPLKKNDTIVTSPFSGIFPEGIMIGTIDNFELKPGDVFYTIEVKLSTNFGNLSHVYIVENLLKGEQKKLESTFKND